MSDRADSSLFSAPNGPNERTVSDTARGARVRVKFAWYDLWVGAYIDRAGRVLYICPLPTLLVEVHLGR